MNTNGTIDHQSAAPRQEVRVLVPSQILERAKRFADQGLYEKALGLLERNKLVFEIYDTFMRMQMPTPKAKTRKYHFSK